MRPPTVAHSTWRAPVPPIGRLAVVASLDGRLEVPPRRAPRSGAGAGRRVSTTADGRRSRCPATGRVQDVGDLPHYTNVQMPFPGPPPRLPARNPTGVYRRTLHGAGGLARSPGRAARRRRRERARRVPQRRVRRLRHRQPAAERVRHHRALVAGREPPRDRGRALQRPQLRRGPGPVVDGRACTARCSSRRARWCTSATSVCDADLRLPTASGGRGRRPRSVRSRRRHRRRLGGAHRRRDARRPAARQAAGRHPVPHEFDMPYVFAGHVARVAWRDRRRRAVVRPSRPPATASSSSCSTRTARLSRSTPRSSASVTSRSATVSCS